MLSDPQRSEACRYCGRDRCLCDLAGLRQAVIEAARIWKSTDWWVDGRAPAQLLATALDRLDDYESGRTIRSASIAKRTIHAEMARRGLLLTQLTPWENPDTERMVYPQADPETIKDAWTFLAWLEAQVTS